MIEVSAGVVQNDQGQILICRRSGGGLDGLWEFPGGKREEGETFEACLARELMEELELPVQVEKRLGQVQRREGQREILLIFLKARALQSQLSLHVHGKALWVSPKELKQYPFCPADAEFLRRYSR